MKLELFFSLILTDVSFDFERRNTSFTIRAKTAVMSDSDYVMPAQARQVENERTSHYVPASRIPSVAVEHDYCELDAADYCEIDYGYLSPRIAAVNGAERHEYSEIPI